LRRTASGLRVVFVEADGLFEGLQGGVFPAGLQEGLTESTLGEGVFGGEGDGPLEGLGGGGPFLFFASGQAEAQVPLGQVGRKAHQGLVGGDGLVQEVHPHGDAGLEEPDLRAVGVALGEVLRGPGGVEPPLLSDEAVDAAEFGGGLRIQGRAPPVLAGAGGKGRLEHLVDLVAGDGEVNVLDDRRALPADPNVGVHADDPRMVVQKRPTA